jgi:predicted transcriptional regulator
MAMTLRLTEEQDLKVAELAQKLGCSKHQAVLRAIEAFDAKAARQRELKQILDVILVRDKELLDRLADA